jgi:hypothetical protein
MARIAWKFEDLTLATTEYMSINPNEGASPTFRKSLEKRTTTAPDGGAAVVIFEGADEPTQFDFSGVILTQAQYTFLQTAWAKRHLLRLTDDLGRIFTLYIESFSPKRKLSRTYPWRHEYEMTTVVVASA